MNAKITVWNDTPRVSFRQFSVFSGAKDGEKTENKKTGSEKTENKKTGSEKTGNEMAGRRRPSTLNNILT